MMYEGKNIHYSSADRKLLCSFSGKLCNQRRLNGYGFCVRHILEDPTAPFKRCAYVAKSSNQMCTQAIPKHEERRYCNNHMQVLGMLPKKERKKKDKPTVVQDNKLHLTNSGSLKAKFSLSKDNCAPLIKPSPSIGDPNDPYAFPDTGPAENKPGELPGSLPVSCDSILGKSLQSGQGFVRAASDISSTAGFGLSGGSTIAKFYPELAEKLEKMRAKPETKVTAKNRARSSRTMNKLQTKIAQNKINEKLRKSQELSQTDSNSSPLQMSSPEHCVEFENSPSPGQRFSPSTHTFSPQASVTANFSTNLTLSGYEQQQGTHDIPPLPHVDTSFLATLAAQDNLGFQNSISETGLSDRLLTTHTPPRLPPPYPGSSTLSTPSSLASADLSASAFSPQTHLNCVLETISTSHSPQRTTITQTGPSGPPSLPSLSFSSPHPLHTNIQPPNHGFHPPTSSSSFPSSGTCTYPFPTSTDSQIPAIKSLNNRLPILPSANVDIFSLLNLNSKQLSIDPTSGLPHMLPSPSTMAAHLRLPPPPPYVPPVTPPKVAATTQQSIPQSKISLQTTTPSGVLPKTSVPHTKLHKLTGILSEKVAKRKLKSDLSVKFYSFYAKRRISNHCMVGPYLGSSDDDSEDGDTDMLPWQRDVFSASSDEDADDDDDMLGNDVPMGMRPTKLSLLKTRLRRQWCQARSAYKNNKLVRSSSNQATLALIRTVRESAACAVRALWQIKHVKKSKRKLQRRLYKKKVCCHKNEKEGQCQSQCLPYANHCLKHITYNINQQLFDFCTAKFANNVQCCLPSFDLRHELPLCQEHAAKTDNYQKQLELENKKKPRKKSKPPALTRPPRKGKKKKKGRYARVQNPVNQSAGLDSTLSDVDVTSIDTGKQEEEMALTSASISSHEKQASHSTSQAQTSAVTTGFTTTTTTTSKNIDHGMELEETMSPVRDVFVCSSDYDKPFELPLEQASRLLDESDFQEVVNKMPFDALDLFGKNGDPESDMTSDLTSASKARDALEKLLTGTMSEEESMQIAMLLAQNLQTDVDLTQNTGLISDSMPNSNSHGDTRMLAMSGNMGMDISMTPHLVMPSVSDSAILGIHTSSLNDSSGLGVTHVGMHSSLQHQVLHQHQLQQLSLASASSIPVSYGHQDLKINTASFHQQTLSSSSPTFHQQTLSSSSPTFHQQTLSSSSPSSSTTINRIPSVFTADLNAIYEHLENVSQSHLSVEQNSGLNLNHIMSLKTFSAPPAKTVIRHLPSSSQPLTSIAGSGTQNLYAVSTHMGYPSEIVGTTSVSHIPQSKVSLELSRNMMNLETSVTTQGYNTSSLPVINAQSRLDSGVSYQNMLPQSSSSEYSESHLLSLPSRAKKAKLMTSTKPSVIAPQPHQQQLHQRLQPHHHQHTIQHQQLPQLSQQSLQHILQTASSPQNRTLTIPDTPDSIRPPDKPQTSSQNPQLITTSTKSTVSAAPSTSTYRFALPGVETLHLDSSKISFSTSALLTPENSKAKLHTQNMLLSDLNRSRMNIPENLMNQQTISSLVSTAASFSSAHLSPKSINTVRYSLTADNSLVPATTVTTTIRHNLLTSPSGPTTESILVTVRQPSPLESVPTTVRHTLPDTLLTPITLPSPPSLLLPPSSTSSSSSPSQDVQDLNSQTRHPQPSITTQSSSSFHPELQRPQWVPIGTNISIQNGLPFVSAISRTQLAHKLSPAGQGSVKNKQNNAAAEAARISALASAAGVPVVCSQVSLPGFVQGIPTATFKSSGSS